MHCFILAGGFATRLWPITEKRAKPLLPLAGKPLLTHIVEGVPAGMPITVSTNAVFAESFLAWQRSIDRPVRVIIEKTNKEDEKIGAMGALLQWMRDEKIAEDVLLLAGDNYLGFKLSDFLQHYEPGVPLLAVREIGNLEDAKRFGTVIVGQDGHTMVMFEEKPKQPKSSLVSTTCSVLPAQHMDAILAYSARSPDNPGGLWEEFLKLGIRATCFPFTEPWFDVGSFEAYLDATKTLVGDRCIAAPTSTSHDVQSERSVVIGDRTTVRNSTLRNTVLFAECTIEDCILEDCIIDDRCVLQGIDLTGKMIRAGTVLVSRI